MAFPEVTLARDFIADVARGDGIGAALDSLGYIGPVSNLLKENTVLATYFGKNAGREVDAAHDLIDFEKNLKPDDAEELYSDYRTVDGFGVVLDDNMLEFNHIPGNNRYYNPQRGKTVLGTFDIKNANDETYIMVGDKKGANYQNIENLEWTPGLHPSNIQILDCAIGNDDDIILSIHPDVVKSTIIAANKDPEKSKFLMEVDYLKSFGYKISDLPDGDGYYHMVIT